MSGYSENVSVDEGVDQQGIRTRFHFEGDDITVQKTFDAEPHLKHAENARIQTQGMRWGEGRLVGHIPPVFYAKILQMPTQQERQKAIRQFLRDNPKFVMFDRYKP